VYLTSLVSGVGSERIVTHSAEGIPGSTAGQSVAVAAATATAAVATTGYRRRLLCRTNNTKSNHAPANKVSLLRTSAESGLLTRRPETRLLQHALEGLGLETATATGHGRVGIRCGLAIVANVRITCRSCRHLFLREENLTPTRGATPPQSSPPSPLRREQGEPSSHAHAGSPSYPTSGDPPS